MNSLTLGELGYMLALLGSVKPDSDTCEPIRQQLFERYMNEFTTRKKIRNQAGA